MTTLLVLQESTAESVAVSSAPKPKPKPKRRTFQPKGPQQDTHACIVRIYRRVTQSYILADAIAEAAEDTAPPSEPVVDSIPPPETDFPPPSTAMASLNVRLFEFEHIFQHLFTSLCAIAF